MDYMTARPSRNASSACAAMNAARMPAAARRTGGPWTPP